MEAYLIQTFSVVLNIVLLYGFKRYTERQRKNEQVQRAIEEGLRSLLRDRITEAYIRYTKQGHIALDELTNVTGMYNAYKELDGNGVVTSMYKKLLELPKVINHGHEDVSDVND